MTRRALRGSHSLSLVPFFLLAACSPLGGPFDGIASPQTAGALPIETVTRTAMLDGFTWEPIPLRMRTGADVRSIEIEDGTIYVVDSKMTAHAIDASTGLHRWVLPLSKFPTRPVAVGDAHVAFLSRSHLTVATRSSGTALLRSDLEFTPSSDAVITLDTLYAGAWGDGTRLRAVALENGWNGWFYTTGGPIVSAPLIVGSGADRMVYFATTDGSVIAIPPRSAEGAAPAEANWMVRTLGRNSADLATDGDHIFVASEDHGLYALNRASGAIVWKWLGAQTPLLEKPAVTEDVLYQPFAGMVAAINKSDGMERWRFPGAEAFLTRIGRRDYLRLPGNGIAVVDAATGEELARSDSSLFEFLAVNDNGGALVFSDGETIYSMR